jgi:hypothetical protein
VRRCRLSLSGDSEKPNWALGCGADVGNGTRVFSLGTRVIILHADRNLRPTVVSIVREWPLLTALLATNRARPPTPISTS